MADDIDIEEHDVLDNPKIKDMLLDITNIKTEIDYEENENVSDDNEFEEDNYAVNQPEVIPEYLEDIPDYVEDIPRLYQNKIILGSRPCESTSSEEEEPEILECSVVLENWGDLLKNNPCFCWDCEILFPTENALDSHKMTAHSFLVAVGRNKAIKSTAKSSIAARLTFESDSNITYNLCNHCDMVFPDQMSFLKHYYEVVTRKLSCDICDSVFDNEVTLRLHLKTHTTVMMYLCPVCSCHFKFVNRFTIHMIYQHHVELKKIPQRVKTTHKCPFCSKTMRDNKSYNNHVHKNHSELYDQTVEEISEKDRHKGQSSSLTFQCQPCNLNFLTAYAQKIHFLVTHNIKLESSSKSVDLDKQIKMEPLSSKIAQSGLKQEFIRRPVPKCTVFKCNKCQIHFVSSLVAMVHMKKCKQTKSNWKCNKCRRSFMSVDSRIHLMQHDWSDRLRVVTVDDDLSNRLLCRCLSCKICTDERTLIKSHECGCAKRVSFLCNVCNLNIHVNAITKHTKAHNEIGPESFVVVDFVNFDRTSLSKTKLTNRNLGLQKLVTEKPVKVFKKFKFYYYCSTCKCYMKVNKVKDRHSVGKCKKHLQKCLCKLCGLTFSIKGYKTHTKDHKKFPRLKLKDLEFKCTESGMNVNPPPPEFAKCRNCEVKFFSIIALKNHVCNGDDPKTCEYCGDKLSDLAYKLHVPFHEYADDSKKDVNVTGDRDNETGFENIPELIKKYDSLKIIWNILFLCETCDTAFKDYDEAVEHSQNHFCNMESYNVTINRCKTCDLNFVGSSYENHKKLHLAKTITRDSFEILPFKYDNLLKDEWYDIFKTLSKDQRDQIRNKSKYKHTRSVRMYTEVDGLIDLTLYRCGACEAIVDWNLIEEHVRFNNCANAVKFECNVCKLSFSSKFTMDSHEFLHDKRRARIISFNAKNDFLINDVLKSKINLESLKFIRCQQCGKLINKAKYKKHVLQHKYYERNKNIRNKLVKTQPKLVIRPKFVKDTAAVRKFYKCRKCGVCIFKKNIHKHLCSSRKWKRQCPKCSLWFRSNQLPKHLMYHDKYKITKNNLHVHTFNKGEIDNERCDKVVLHQCADCSVCLHRQANIKRHICLRSNYQKVCNLCEMPFHCSRIQLHQQFHEDKNFSKKDIIVKKFKSLKVLDDFDNEVQPSPVHMEKYSQRRHIKKYTETRYAEKYIDRRLAEKYSPRRELQDKEFFRHIHLRFYKCKCKLLFVTSETFLEHTVICENDRIGVVCDICGLMFHKSNIDIHKNVKKCPHKTCTIFIVTLKNKPLTYDDTKCFYGCEQCNINYLTFRAAMSHIESGHVVKRKPIACDVCEVRLSEKSHRIHQKMHHTHRQLTSDDMNRYIVIDVSVNNVIKDSPDRSEVQIEEYVKSDYPVYSVPCKADKTDERKSIKRKLVTEETISKQMKREPLDNPIATYTYDLYPCKTCHLNFLSKKTLKCHFLGSHNEKKVTCAKCSLQFTQHSLTRHMRQHHDNPLYSNYRLNYSVYTDNFIATEIKKEPAEEESIATEDRIEEPEKQQQTDNRATDKLYKCNECDVYYLLPEACRDHVANHTVLDPTEYIACKICDLQFPCEYLGSHMKRHREKTFNIDEIIVEEYQFKDGEIIIDSYPAVDRLKSKLVTTTTHFDTEDEKNDDSTVGSTVSLNDNRNDFTNKDNNVELISNNSETVSSFFFLNETNNC